MLTTNRISAIDTAFESRIDIALAYHELESEERAQVWRNFFAGLPSEDISISEDDVQEIAKSVLNGRQIKSAVKTARILARKEAVPLNLKHLQAVLQVRESAKKLINGSAYSA